MTTATDGTASSSSPSSTTANASAGMYMTEKSEDEPRFHLCESASLYARAATGLSAVALIFHIVAMASPYWILADMRGDEAAHVGLWIECTMAGRYTTNPHWVCLTFAADHHINDLPVFLKASQGFAILGLMLVTATLFLLGLYTILPKLNGRKIASFLALAFSIVAGTFIIIGAIVYAAKYPRPQDILELHEWRLGYAFAFEILVCIMCYVLAALILVDMRKSMLITSIRFF